MTNITQKVLSITTGTIIIAIIVLIEPLAISSAQAAGPTFCPCFSSTIIDAEMSEASGNGLQGMLNGTNGGFTCADDGDEVFLSFNNEDRSVNITVFGETFSASPGPGCGWSGRPLDTTTQEARECQDQIKESWAWKVLACPNI